MWRSVDQSSPGKGTSEREAWKETLGMAGGWGEGGVRKAEARSISDMSVSHVCILTGIDNCQKTFFKTTSKN